MTALRPFTAGTSTARVLWDRLVRERVRERAFWRIQAMVAGVTGLHALAEAMELFTGERWLAVGLHYFPVILYVVPVVYAGLRYGFEGSALTGAWCVVLSLPNVFLWHAESFQWAGELLYVVGVVVVGLVVAVPVERDRRRQQRFELLNDVSSTLVAEPLEEALPRLLERVRDALNLSAAAVVSAPPWGPSAAVPRELDPELRLLVNGGALADRHAGGDVLDHGVIAVPLGEERGIGALVVWTPAERLERDDCDLLASVAGQVGLALENRRLDRRAEQRLRSYVQGVTRAQEDERKRIARELHDTAAQELVHLCRGLDSRDEADGALRELAEQTLESLRRLSRDLRPTVLDDLGLVPALEWLAADLTGRGIRADCQVSGDVRRLPPEVELALFRITQEAFRNVEKHAHASQADVEVCFNGDHVAVTVTDDGCGIAGAGSADQLVRSGKLGLAGMHERAQLIGGRLAITTRTGGGTRVAVSVEHHVGSSVKNRSAGTNISA